MKFDDVGEDEEESDFENSEEEEGDNYEAIHRWIRLMTVLRVCQ